MTFRHRVRNVLLAFRGEDVMADHGLQRFGPDGRIETLVKVPIASWVPSDDVDVATAKFGKQIERAFGRVDWDDRAESKHVRSTAAAIRRLEAE